MKPLYCPRCETDRHRVLVGVQLDQGDPVHVCPGCAHELASTAERQYRETRRIRRTARRFHTERDTE